MKKIKKMPLVIASIIILVLIAGISIFFLNARETKNEENANANNGEIEENMKGIIPYIILVVAVICITVAIIVIKKKEK